MDTQSINELLLRGDLDAPGLFPHLEELSGQPFVFPVDFGLVELPREPGLLLIRGARQYGKSTWLESQLKGTLREHGAGTAFYLNGDELASADALHDAIELLIPLYAKGAMVRRLFIDEITAIPNWERSLKRLIDRGALRRVLVVTTGSKATDLRRGAERLPGRKGRLARTSYLFTPISYASFKRVAGDALGDRALTAYLLSGGCPLAASELASSGRLPEFVVSMVRDWILGECALSGRSRQALLAVLDVLLTRGASALGQARLAREAGLSNNTVAAGYIELLSDLMCVGVAHPWDPSTRRRVLRRPAKFPFINLLAAVAWDPTRPRALADFEAWPPDKQGVWLEWLVAQELWRRAAIRGDEVPEGLTFWASKEREIDFVVSPDRFIEVKRGRTSALEHAWFAKVFPRGELVLVGRDRFETERIRGVSLEDFLLEEG
jgi:uncharacterized protein